MNQLMLGSRSLVAAIAILCHETNRAYCGLIGDFSQVPWDEAPEWQRESAMKGVMFHLDNPEATASASHESWLKEKEETGWKYGLVKNPELKEHPCFVPFDQLPEEQQAKDKLFKGIVDALRPRAIVFGTASEDPELSQNVFSDPTLTLVAHVQEVRADLKSIEVRVRKQRTDTLISPRETYPGQHGEMLGQSMLAVRAIEEARMRLGKVLQYAGDGVSIYDKA